MITREEFDRQVQRLVAQDSVTPEVAALAVASQFGQPEETGNGYAPAGPVTPPVPGQPAAEQAAPPASGSAPGADAARTAAEDPEQLGRRYRPLSDPVTSDADMAGAVARQALSGFCWAGGLGWRRYDRELGTWAAAPEEVVIEQIRRFMLSTVARVLEMSAAEALAGKDGSIFDGLALKWRKYAQAARMVAIARLVRGILLVDASKFDAWPDLLNCPNGVLDLRTGELGPHDPALLLTQVAGADWVPGARHPDIDKALEAIPADVLAYAQLRYGQGITGHKPPDDVLDVQHGGGENGKTTILTAVKHAAGGYAAVLPAALLLADPRAHTTELMTLRGVRIGIIEELPEEHYLSVTRIKVATAPTITARLVHRDNVTFDNACSLIISNNYRLQIRETDHGTWRRLEGSIPFPYTFRKPHERLRDGNDRRGDGTLRQRIETDDGSRGAAMLAWLAEGARRWYAGEDGRPPMTMGQPPQRVLDDVAEWRMSCDLVYAYITDRLEFDAGSHVISEELRAGFNDWARERGHREWTLELLSARFSVHSLCREHGVTKIRPRAGQEPGLVRLPGSSMKAPERYTAWRGVRFRTAQDSKTAGGTGWSGRDQSLQYGASRKGFMIWPDHPDQAGFRGHPQPDWLALWRAADHAGAAREAG